MKYIAGVSGGPDSMALLDKYKKKITLVCHVNYNKRDTAIRDRKIVSDYCKKNKINLKILNVTDKIYKVYKKKSNNFQNIARLIRYDFFLKNAKKINCYNLLISHNLNDFVETGIMQIKRNSKALFYGIKKNSNYKDLNIIRPLLFKPKINLKKYCETHNVSYGIDESNFSDLYERNRIRKTIDKTSLKYFYKKILKHNKKNAKLNTKITKLYSAWKQKNYLDTFLNSQNDECKYHMAYRLLSENDIPNISSTKIDSLLKFAEKSKKNKSFRLTNDLFICKK